MPTDQDIKKLEQTARDARKQLDISKNTDRTIEAIQSLADENGLVWVYVRSGENINFQIPLITLMDSLSSLKLDAEAQATQLLNAPIVSPNG